MPLERRDPRLVELNHWAALRGPGAADSGEVGARIATLRAELAASGVRVVEHDGTYVLVEDETRRLLEELNQWAALRDPEVADTGEIGSRIDALLARLREFGVQPELRDGRYRVEPPAASPDQPE